MHRWATVTIDTYIFLFKRLNTDNITHYTVINFCLITIEITHKPLPKIFNSTEKKCWLTSNVSCIEPWTLDCCFGLAGLARTHPAYLLNLCCPTLGAPSSHPLRSIYWGIHIVPYDHTAAEENHAFWHSDSFMLTVKLLFSWAEVRSALE